MEQLFNANGLRLMDSKIIQMQVCNKKIYVGLKSDEPGPLDLYTARSSSLRTDTKDSDSSYIQPALSP